MKKLIAELKKLGVKATPTMGRNGEHGILFNNGEREMYCPINLKSMQSPIVRIFPLMTEEKRTQIAQWHKDQKKLTYVLKKQLQGDELARPFFDMWIVPQIVLAETQGERMCGSIRPGALENWGVDGDTVFDVAFENACQNHTITPMRSILAEMMGVPEEMMPEDNPPMYVCSNKSRVYGAGAMLDKNLLHKISDMTRAKQLIIFPSSIHECIVVPFMETVDPDMVREINSTQLKEEEVLSNNTFVYEDGEYYLLH